MNDQNINVIFDAINQFQTKNISFHQAYQIVYELIMSNPIEVIIEDLKIQIDTHFQNFIINTYQREFDTSFSRFSIVSKEFYRYKRIIYNLFCMIERYISNKFSLNHELDQLFIKIFKSLTDFDELLHAFFEKFETFHFSELEINPEFDDLILLSKLIHFSCREKESLDIISDRLLKETEKSAQNFVNGTIDLNAIEYVNTANRYLIIDESLLYHLFYKEAAENAILSVYRIFISSVENQLFERIIDQIKESCKNRDKSFIIEYYKLISFRAPTEDLLAKFSEAIHDQIKIESVENIIEFGKAVSFYSETFESINNTFLTKRYNRQIINFINLKKKDVFKNLFSFISKVATSNPDISPIRSILGRIESKYEFEQIYSRHATKRIVPPTEKQIKIENSIITQIQSTSSSYEFSKLLNLLNEASQSIERNIGPVLICSLSVWPFPQPFSKCSYFDSICEDIQSKFSKLNPNRILTFPFDSWVVCVKNTVKNYIMSGNAVQAEVFLYLNNHDIIHKDTFSPRVSSVQMSSVLKSLSSKKMPLLTEKTTDKEITYFSLNPNFKNKFLTFKLPMPAFVYKAAQKDLIQAKNEQIDAAITRVMKGKRKMRCADLESKIINKLSNRYRVTSDEVKGRVNELIAREFLEMNEEENTIIYLP